MDTTIHLYDSLRHSATYLADGSEPVGIYVCGPTVYQRAHIGNARPYVVFSWLSSFLEFRGREVRFVHNITDVNDKIYSAAEGEPSTKLAARATDWYIDDIGSLELRMPDAMPTVTGHMAGIIAYIERLISAGVAYESHGDVYFSVRHLETYGSLSRRIPDEIEDPEPSALKRDVLDFALWKATKPGEDIDWQAPWGRGRPGWHIECSAMSEAELGSSFAIHGGGLDLVFPHHENELAQSAALKHAGPSIWMHNGMVNFAGEKMSKSSGNITSIRDAIARWGRETILIWFMSGKWRSELVYSEVVLESGQERLRTIRNAVDRHRPSPVAFSHDERSRLVNVLTSDFNTAGALAIFHEWAARGLIDNLLEGLKLFGLGSILDQRPPSDEVSHLAVKRREARSIGDFVESDRLRDEIANLGFEVRDNSDGGGYTLHEL